MKSQKVACWVPACTRGCSRGFPCLPSSPQTNHAGLGGVFPLYGQGDRGSEVSRYLHRSPGLGEASLGTDLSGAEAHVCSAAPGCPLTARPRFPARALLLHYQCSRNTKDEDMFGRQTLSRPLPGCRFQRRNVNVSCSSGSGALLCSYPHLLIYILFMFDPSNGNVPSRRIRPLSGWTGGW